MKPLKLILEIFGKMFRKVFHSVEVLNDEEMIYLDAESLAEIGIEEAYAELNSYLNNLGITPDSIQEETDSNIGLYTVRHKKSKYNIYGPNINSRYSWGLATYALFSIVNEQLSESNFKFYARHGGNDLYGIFLTDEHLQQCTDNFTNKG